MGLIKDIFGLGCSALITGGLFLGAPIVGIVYSLIPNDMVDTLVKQPRPPVYFEGAYELSEVEIDGDLDATADVVVDEPEPEPEDEPEPESANPDEPPSDEPAAEKGGGGEVAADPVLDNDSGTKAGRGDGVLRPRGGRAEAAAKRRKKRSRRKCAKSYDGIRQRGDGTYLVNRELVTYYTASIKHFNELGWSKANDRGDGKGWYITGFGCNDPLWHGGLRPRDVVLRVNGKKTNNMLQVFMLYSRVKLKKHFTVEVRRRGKQVTLRYQIVKS